MAQSFAFYNDANFFIVYGLIICCLLVTATLYKWYVGVFSSLTKQILNIGYNLTDDGKKFKSMSFYGDNFQAQDGNCCFSYMLPFCFIIMVSMTIAGTLITLVDGMVLSVVYLPRNEKCPDYGDMHCYSTSNNHSYFFCNSSDIVIPESFGSVNCYRWAKRNMSTLIVLEQIGICTGLFEALKWVITSYLRLMHYALQVCHKTQCSGCTRLKMIFILLLILLPFLGSIIMLAYFKTRKTAVTGLTMGVLSCIAAVGFSAMFMMCTLWFAGTKVDLDNKIQPLYGMMSQNSHGSVRNQN
ncbi:hypothetical protein I4U23_016929 [Adineta vaga]|nr:hypothetical protein I4U23_016929 [Adineta vaga]